MVGNLLQCNTLVLVDCSKQIPNAKEGGASGSNEGYHMESSARIDLKEEWDLLHECIKAGTIEEVWTQLKFSIDFNEKNKIFNISYSLVLSTCRPPSEPD